MAFEMKFQSDIKYNDLYEDGDHYVGSYIFREPNLRMEINVFGNKESVLAYQGTSLSFVVKEQENDNKLESSICKNTFRSLADDFCNKKEESYSNSIDVLKDFLKDIEEKISMTQAFEKEIDLAKDRKIIIKINTQNKKSLIVNMKTGCIHIPMQSRDDYELDGTCSSVNFSECNNVNLDEYFSSYLFSVANRKRYLGKYKMSFSCVVKQIG